MVALELAQVALLLDELEVVVLAVEPSLVRNVVRWADRAPSMAALEAALMVRSSVYRHLSFGIQTIRIMLNFCPINEFLSFFLRECVCMCVKIVPFQLDRQCSCSQSICLSFHQTYL